MKKKNPIFTLHQNQTNHPTNIITQSFLHFSFSKKKKMFT